MDKSKIRKYLMIGLIGAFITLAGEMSQGLAPSVGIQDMQGLFATHAALPVWRIGFGSTVGAVGIILQFFGVWAIYLSFNKKADRASQLYRIGAYNYAFMGATVHILMSVMIWAYKVEGELPLDFTLWFAAPFLAVFLVVYGVFCVIMGLKFRRGETIFPKACWLLNPLIGKVFFKAVAALIPAGALANGISFSNMGLTAVIMFAVLWHKAE